MAPTVVTNSSARSDGLSPSRPAADDPPQLLREAGDAAQQHLDRLGRSPARPAPGRPRRPGRPRSRNRSRALSPPGRAAEVVVQLVPGDPPQPGPEVVPPPERRQVPVRREEDLLGQVVHVVGVVDLAGDVAAQREAELADDQPEGVAVAPADLVEHGVDLLMLEHAPLLSPVPAAASRYGRGPGFGIPRFQIPDSRLKIQERMSDIEEISGGDAQDRGNVPGRAATGSCGRRRGRAHRILESVTVHGPRVTTHYRSKRCYKSHATEEKPTNSARGNDSRRDGPSRL